VRWASRHDGYSRKRLVLSWEETGGPPVVAPPQVGYGSSVIRDLIPYELGGEVEFTLAPDGVHCRIDIPLS
jgi:two-component sensor histidine kinase